jgi:hypothetical protein
VSDNNPKLSDLRVNVSQKDKYEPVTAYSFRLTNGNIQNKITGSGAPGREFAVRSQVAELSSI